MKLAGVFLACSFAAVQASPIGYTASLDGASEVPPNASPATGFITATIDTTAHTLDVNLSFTGLIGGNAQAAHIHCCAPFGMNVIVAVGFPGFPPTTSGLYSHMFDLTDVSVYNGAFVTAHGGTAASAEAALAAGLAGNMAYSNIHNMNFPGGEIRGNLVAAVPEPTSAILLGSGLLLAGFLRRRLR